LNLTIPAYKTGHYAKFMAVATAISKCV